MRALKLIVPAAFWLIVYEVIALIIGNSYFFPRLSLVLESLFSILAAKTFFSVCAMTLLRVLTALLLGILIGIALGLILLTLSLLVNIVLSIMQKRLSR